MRALAHAKVSKIRCPPASAELAMAGRPLVSSTISLPVEIDMRRYSVIKTIINSI